MGGRPSPDSDPAQQALEKEQEQELATQKQEEKEQKQKLADRQLSLIRRMQGGGGISPNGDIPTVVTRTIG